MKVDRYVEPEEFAHWKRVAEDIGFLYVASGPLVRSSYKVGEGRDAAEPQAGEFFIENVLKKRRASQPRHADVQLSSGTSTAAAQ